MIKSHEKEGTHLGLPAKLVRSQLNFFKPFVANCSLEITRKGQDKLGELMEAIHRRDVYVRDHDFGLFSGAWLIPKDERRQGVVLYLHGGGYTCGNLDAYSARPTVSRRKIAIPPHWTMLWKATAIF